MAKLRANSGHCQSGKYSDCLLAVYLMFRRSERAKRHGCKKFDTKIGNVLLVFAGGYGDVGVQRQGRTEVQHAVCAPCERLGSGGTPRIGVGAAGLSVVDDPVFFAVGRAEEVIAPRPIDSIGVGTSKYRRRVLLPC